MKAMLTRDSPFYIKPRIDWELWTWLWRFARRCNKHDMLAAGRAIQALLNSSRTLYEQLMSSEPFDCEWELRGLLFVFRGRKQMEHYGETDRLLRDSFNMPAVRYDGEAVRELEPALKPGLAGGWHYTADAHLRPDRLMSSWRHVLESLGVGIVERCELSAFVSSANRAHSIRTSQGEMDAEAFVVAAGAWTPLLDQQLGCKIPIQPGKGYSITMPRPAKCPTIPLIFEECRVAVTPMQSGYRLGSTMEFAGYDATLNRRRLDLLKAGASHYLEEPYGKPVEEEWFGWRPMTPDSVPIIDRSPAHGNVLIAAGHNMLGVSMSPATGRLVAEILGDGQPHVDLRPYALARFAR
jgi:D-amino-acid dehydrogenase